MLHTGLLPVYSDVFINGKVHIELRSQPIDGIDELEDR